MTNVVFSNNSAPYGNNIASYPVKVVDPNTNSSGMTLTDFASGQPLGRSLKFTVVDHDNQVSSVTNGGRVSIVPIDKGASVLGESSSSIVGGIATFNNIILAAKPGSTNIRYSLTSTSIDTSKLLKQYGRTSIQDPMVVDFRLCKPGENEQSNRCQTCIAGTYSLKWNSTTCESCPEFMSCLGGTQLHLNQGYWRSSLNSTDAIECLRESACDGGYAPSNEFPVN